MLIKTRATNDPRTIGRDIRGVFDAVVPQLAPPVVGQFNNAYGYHINGGSRLESEVLKASNLQHAMLFEIAVAIAEEKIHKNGGFDWMQCLGRAGKRQKRYFDATIPDEVTDADRTVALRVADNLVAWLAIISDREQLEIQDTPFIPGFRWISAGVGDFATANTLIEVKCSRRRFSTADYRQILIYWLLKHIYTMEFGGKAWENVALVNPRLCLAVEFPVADLLLAISQGQPLDRIVELFCAIISEPQDAGNWHDHLHLDL